MKALDQRRYVCIVIVIVFFLARYLNTLLCAPSNLLSNPSIRQILHFQSLFIPKQKHTHTHTTHLIVSFYFIFFFTLCSLGPLETLPREMVSRRKILSRSRDDLNLEHHQQYVTQDDEEDVWYQKDKLYKVSFHFCVVYFYCSINSMVNKCCKRISSIFTNA